MPNITQILANTFLFAGLPETQLRQMEQIAVDCYFEKGATIFLEGDEGIGFFVVAEGTVKIFKVSIEGKEHILHIFGPGEPVGEVPVFTAKPFPANAQAIVKTRLLFFPRKAFVQLISSHPPLALNMLAILSKRLRDFTVQIENLALKEVSGRLASYIMLLFEKQPENAALTLEISKGQLASILGTIPETLSRIFAKMTAQNLIEVTGRQIRVLNRDGLKELAKYGKVQEV